MGGLVGMKGRQLPRSLRASPAARAMAPALRDATTGAVAGGSFDYAANQLGYDTNLGGMGAIAGGLRGAGRKLLSRPIKQGPVLQAAEQFGRGAMDPVMQIGEQLGKGWQRLQGKPVVPASGRNISSTFLGNMEKPAPGPMRAARNLGYAAGAIPLATGAYGIAANLGEKGIQRVADTAGEAIEGRMDQYLNSRLPQLTGYMRDQANDYLGQNVPHMLDYAGQYAQEHMPGLIGQGVNQLQQHGVLGSSGGIRIQPPNPMGWLTSLYHRYANQPSTVGQGYH